MAQIIEMSRAYQKRPSEILGIDDEYTAYCFDEVALYLLAKATDREGKLNWDRLKWRDGHKRNNRDFMEFIKKQ